MKVNRSFVATNPTAGPPRRQIGWPRRENDRRRAAYDARAEAWRQHEDHLVRLRIEAAEFLGSTEPRTGLPAELDHDEVVYRVLPAAELIEAEARHLAGLPAPGLTVAGAPVDEPGRALPAGLRVVDAGMAVVTDRRVVFGGHDGRREWAYTGMLGLGHHHDVPITLLHTTDGRRPAGLRIPAATAVNTRFYLTLAFATAVGARAAIGPQLDALLAAHRDARPSPPPPVAPLPLPRPERVAAAAVVVAAVALGTLATGTSPSGPADLPYRGQAPTGGTAATPGPVPAAGNPVPVPPTDPEPPDSPVSRPSATVAVTRPAGGAAGGPAGQPVSRGDNVPAARVAATPPRPTARPGPPATLAAAATQPPTSPPALTATPTPTTMPSPDPSRQRSCPDLLRLPLVGPLLCLPIRS